MTRPVDVNKDCDADCPRNGIVCTEVHLVFLGVVALLDFIMSRRFDLGADLDGYVHEHGHVRRRVSS